MPLSNHLTVFVYLQLSLTIFADKNSTNISGVDGKNTSFISCKTIQFDEIKLAKVLHLMREPAINTVEITVTVASANRTRIFPEMVWPWASEIGRTLISLISRAKTSIFASSLYTFALEVGVERVVIEVTEEPIGCLPSGEKGSNQIFKLLLNDLFFHMEDNYKDMYYKLCLPHHVEGPSRFNCCRIIGNRTICADYDSMVLKWARPGSIVVVAIFAITMLPFLLDHIMTYPEITFYKTSFSHMSLISIISMIFFEGYGHFKSFLRRFVFVLLTLIVFLPVDFFEYSCLKILFSIWAALFCLYPDKQITNGEFNKQKDKKLKPYFGKNLIFCFTFPIHLHENYRKSKDRTDGGSDKSHRSCKKLFSKLGVYILVFILVIICSLIVYPFIVGVFLIIYVLFNFPLGFVVPQTSFCKQCFLKVIEFIFGTIIRLVTLVVMVFFTGSILIFLLSITVGLILNGAFFNPFIAPIVTLIVFFWKNWKFSVEARCLQLKTLITEVCEDKMETTGTDESHAISNNEPESSEWDFLFWWRHTCIEASRCSDSNNSQENGENVENNYNGDKLLAIKFEEKTGVTMISKKLYEEISKIIFPLDYLLFHFVRRFFFVFVYAFLMLIVLILAKDSGIMESVQALSAIVAILLPFIFDTIYADHHTAQKTAVNMATKEKLEHIILRVKKQKENLFLVQLKYPNKFFTQLLKSMEQSLSAIEKLIGENVRTIEPWWLITEQSWKAIECSWQTMLSTHQQLELIIQQLELIIQQLNPTMQQELSAPTINATRTVRLFNAIRTVRFYNATRTVRSYKAMQQELSDPTMQQEQSNPTMQQEQSDPTMQQERLNQTMQKLGITEQQLKLAAEKLKNGQVTKNIKQSWDKIKQYLESWKKIKEIWGGINIHGIQLEQPWDDFIKFKKSFENFKESWERNEELEFEQNWRIIKSWVLNDSGQLDMHS
ncbi:uncharacterized protein LOC114524108 isoform X2 [Dendronephthya gigantea]|uniref:uncharacterized protein LOC114524108 isoform X2 n=1 Tax=Dendronephthya gigantea TaxID=151771 RepID=UPI00106A4844|nr:uncharacterized protein LOC114524108 isoform X2 [Dendronephthya gigantea]